MIGLKYGFPSAATPVIAPDGTWNTVWYQLLVTLWKRAGSAPGVDTAALSQTITGLLSSSATTSDFFLTGIEDGRARATQSTATADPAAIAMLLAGGRS